MKKETKKMIKKRVHNVALGVLSIYYVAGFASYAFADVDPVAGINLLYTLFVGIVSSIGSIALLWGVVHFALGLKRGDPAATTQGSITVAAGILMVGAGWLVSYITGGR